MSVNKLALTALAYIVLTFVLAFVWHLVFFHSFYDRIGYFGQEEPIVVLGFATIVIQGLVLAYAYPFFQRGGSPLIEAVRVASVFGVFTASVQVLAASAKHHAPATAEWFFFEGLFFFVQISAVAFAFAWIHRAPEPVTHESS